MAVDLDTGAWTRPSLRPPDGFTPEMHDRHAFESPSFEVTFDLPPALTKILKTVHERQGAKPARRLISRTRIADDPQHRRTPDERAPAIHFAQGGTASIHDVC